MRLPYLSPAHPRASPCPLKRSTISLNILLSRYNCSPNSDPPPPAIDMSSRRNARDPLFLPPLCADSVNSAPLRYLFSPSPLITHHSPLPRRQKILSFRAKRGTRFTNVSPRRSSLSSPSRPSSTSTPPPPLVRISVRILCHHIPHCGTITMCSSSNPCRSRGNFIGLPAMAPTVC